MAFNAQIITLFPQMFPGVLGHSILGKALTQGLWELNALDLRQFAIDKHKTVDDTPYGGGAGMLMKPDVMGFALDAAIAANPTARRIFLSPRGRAMNQPFAAELAAESGVILVCGRYEGLDERVIQHYALEEVSAGDMVLTGGEVAAMLLLEGVVRLLPGVLGEQHSASEESFGLHDEYALLLEYPHYTKPPIWNGMEVPPELLSGHHEQIRRWRLNQAEMLTQTRRPDLWEKYSARKRETK
jgi:tRNA (guanine37-N1)-methyltransferase